jgi:hypothetical protein
VRRNVRPAGLLCHRVWADRSLALVALHRALHFSLRNRSRCRETSRSSNGRVVHSDLPHSFCWSGSQQFIAAGSVAGLFRARTPPWLRSRFQHCSLQSSPSLLRSRRLGSNDRRRRPPRPMTHDRRRRRRCRRDRSDLRYDDVLPLARAFTPTRRTKQKQTKKKNKTKKIKQHTIF